MVDSINPCSSASQAVEIGSLAMSLSISSPLNLPLSTISGFDNAEVALVNSRCEPPIATNSFFVADSDGGPDVDALLFLPMFLDVTMK